jgi:hypothetical protein
MPRCGHPQIPGLAVGATFAELLEFDGGTEPETGYADSGERYYCRDCGTSGYVEDTAPALVMLPQPMPKPIASASLPTELPEVA